MGEDLPQNLQGIDELSVVPEGEVNMRAGGPAG